MSEGSPENTEQLGSINKKIVGEVEEQLKIAVPTLIKVGLFELFSVDEWINGQNPGRSFVGLCAKEYFGEN